MVKLDDKGAGLADEESDASRQKFQRLSSMVPKSVHRRRVVDCRKPSSWTPSARDAEDDFITTNLLREIHARGRRTTIPKQVASEDFGIWLNKLDTSPAHSELFMYPLQST